MAKDKGKKKKEADLENQVATATQQASQPSEFFNRIKTRALKWDDFYNSSNPIDFRNAPDNGLGLDLYNTAKAVDKNKNFAQGINSAEGYNANFGKQLDAENQLMAQQNASAGYENYMQGMRDETNQVLSGLDAVDTNRRQNNVSNAQQNLSMFYNKPQKKKWWETAIGLGLGGLGTVTGSGGLAGLIGGGKK